MPYFCEAKCIAFRHIAEMLGPVVQLVRTLACHARGRRFEPDPGRQPNADLAHPVERHLAKVEVASSSLVIRSRKFVVEIFTAFLLFTDNFPHSVLA